MITCAPSTDETNLAKNFMGVYRDRGFGENVLKVTYEEYLKFIYLGKLCEIVFTRKLRESGVEFNSDDQLVPAAGDHRKGADLFLTKTNQEVDIKAAHKANHTRILVREDQFRAHVYDLYIGAKYINDQRIDYYGFITGAALSKVEPIDFGYGPARHFQLNSLKPIELFIELAQAGKVVE
jgi:hypothetical protein